jgi:FKBP-type peptidyl-prolyl cis-trans isomerase
MLLAASALFFVACGEQSADSVAPTQDPAPKAAETAEVAETVAVQVPSQLNAAVQVAAVEEVAEVKAAVEEVAEVKAAVEEVAEVKAAVEEVAEVKAAAEDVAAKVKLPTLPAVEVPESELIELVGYLTAQSAGVATLKLDEAGVAALAEGVLQGLEGKLDLTKLSQDVMKAAFAQAQARAEAVQAGAAELPAIDLDALQQIGLAMVMQTGVTDLGFGVDDAVLIAKGFAAGALATEMDPSIQAKMAAFQAFIQPRAQAAQAKAQAAQAEGMARMEAENAVLAEKNIAAGKVFIEKLSADEGVQSSNSGLRFKVLEAGSDAKPSLTDKVLVHYKGTLIDGTQFDSSYDRGQPAEFPLNGVVPGFGEGLTKIGAGGKIILYIPSELGYGNTPRPGGAIKPGDTLIFECELIEIKPGS